MLAKSRKKPGPKEKERGEHFDESKKKELAASDKLDFKFLTKNSPSYL